MGNASSFTVGDWTVIPGLNRFERAGVSIKIEPRAMDLLICLAKRSPEVVSADELVREVWRGRVVSDGSIYLVINQLRDAFGEGDSDLIETIPKRGYRLAAPVQFLPERNSSREKSIFRGVLPERRRLAAGSALAVVLIATTAIYVSPWSPLRPDVQLEPPTIAVLPFANLRGDEGDDYVGEGIA